MDAFRLPTIEAASIQIISKALRDVLLKAVPAKVLS
jgi:hypothetical protein